MKKLLNLLLINILIFAPAFEANAADKKAADEEKAREIEKALFMAAGAQDRVLRIGLVDCIALP